MQALINLALAIVVLAGFALWAALCVKVVAGLSESNNYKKLATPVGVILGAATLVAFITFFGQGGNTGFDPEDFYRADRR